MFRKFFKYVTQSMAGMIGISIYILADTFFISLHSGANGLTVLNLILPVYGVLYAIGLATWTLENPPYFQLVFLHELAHVAVGGEHNAAFRAYLDSLIARFNEATGAQLVNDYSSEGGAKQ